jgi:hypothetical protein
MGKETDWQGSGKEVRGHCRKYISRYIVSWVINMSEMRETAKASAAQRAAASSERERIKRISAAFGQKPVPFPALVIIH